MSEDVDPIVTALRDLLQSEGWRIFKDAAAASWGPAGYGLEMQRALSTIPHGPDRAYELAQVAEQVDATARAVNQIVTWPAEEISRRVGPKARTGPLDHLRRLTR